jgi:ElaB/YqjD/DUF883 family membrane-anchored ribosome-binding protein
MLEKIMRTHTQTISNDLSTLLDDAGALIAATADAAGEHVQDARQRLAAALGRGQESCGRAGEQAVAGARAAGQAVKDHPYRIIAAGVGVGAILGYLLAHRWARSRV